MQSPATERLLAGSIIDEQINLEGEAVSRGAARYRRLAAEAVRRGDGAALKPAERLLLHWLDPMVKAIHLDVHTVKRNESATGSNVWGAPFIDVGARRAAVIGLGTMLGLCMSEPGGMKVSKLSYAIGKAFLAESGLRRMREHDIKARAARRKRRQEEGERFDRTYRPNERELMTMLSERYRRLTVGRINWWANRNLEEPVWERTACVHIGMRIMWHAIGVATTRDWSEVFTPAFLHERRRDKHKSAAFVRLSGEAFDIIQDGHEVRQFMRPRFLPMVVEPYPWRHDTEGGYVRIRVPLIARPTRAQRDALARADLSRVYECVNGLSSTPWRINSRILSVAREMWERGGGVKCVPPKRDVEIPPKPEAAMIDEKAEREWRRSAKAAYRRNEELHSERADFLHRLDIASMFEDRIAVWFPHQLDFRGRGYPIPQHLNHHGDDLCRGMLEFARARMVTDKGERRLRIHAAGRYGKGVDRLSYDDRIAWTRAHESDIERCVRDPIGCEFWLTAKRPWQFLAACFALVEPESGARLWVQQDGSCNGMQHYAALARDVRAAALVNMLPSDRPEDLYTHVAATVSAIVARDAAARNPHALRVVGAVDRDLVKTNVMTTYYGVTAVGASEQIRSELMEREMPKEELGKLSWYLSQATLKSIGSLCDGASAVMDWLRAIARIVAKPTLSEDRERWIKGAALRWSTPLGFPVLQPYLREHSRRIVTCMQRVTINVEESLMRVSTGKQATAFAPNFIHSIDGTHMLMSAREANDRGIDFAAIHDCFGSHAETADEVGSILREQFVELHEAPLLEDLRNQVSALRPDLDLPPPPPRGGYDIRSILDAPYAFH